MAGRTRSAGGGVGQNRVIGVVAVVLIAVALVAIVQMYRNSQVHVEKNFNLPPGSSEKAQAMKAKGQRPFGEESASDLINPGGTTKK
jgi:hypothetical protein